MESLQPSPSFQRNDELSCYWNLFPAQCHSLEGERDTSSHSSDPSGSSRELRSGWCWGSLPFPAFLSNSQALLSLHSSLIGVSQPLLVPLFSRLVWNLGKSGIILSNTQSSIVLWRSCLQRSWVWVTQAWRTLAGCVLIIKQLSYFTLQAPNIMVFAPCAKTNFFCPSVLVCFFSVKA